MPTSHHHKSTQLCYQEKTFYLNSCSNITRPLWPYSFIITCRIQATYHQCQTTRQVCLQRLCNMQEGSSQDRDTVDGAAACFQSYTDTTLHHHRHRLCWSLQGHTRKLVLVKAYLALFICFATKAVHIEIVSDLTTEAFLASLKQFIARRGLPAEVHIDNGTNFKGAKNDLTDLYHLLSMPTSIAAINSYLLSQRVTWHCMPEHASHFGGLWEAAVKSIEMRDRHTMPRL